MYTKTPSGRRQPPQRTRMILRALAVAIVAWAVWLVFASAPVGPFVLVRAELAPPIEETAMTQLVAAQGATLCSISDAGDLYRCVSQATAGDSLVLSLPPGVLVLEQTLRIPVSATLQGAQGTSVGPGTVLSCGAAPMDSLLEFSGSLLHLIGVQLQDCSGPGLRITSRTDAYVTLEDSVFYNFTRVLVGDGCLTY
jgi:hypothetical protein